MGKESLSLLGRVQELRTAGFEVIINLIAKPERVISEVYFFSLIVPL